MFGTASSLLVALLLHSTLVAAHVRLGTKIKGYGRLQNVDGFENRSPINSDKLPAEKKVICKGYHKGAGNDSRTSLKPGKNQFDLETEMAPHNGGSMQVSLSFDGAATFKVIKSFIGGFPRNGGGNTVNPNQVYDFDIPADTQAGDAIFSWSWSNEVGNREWYQDCAPVKIEGDGKNKLEKFPDMFIANAETLTKTCKNDEGASVEYPAPGDFVERGPNKTAPPKGDCGKVVAGGGGGDKGTPTTTAPPPAEGGGGGGGSYTVVSGDTCDGIAGKKGTTSAKIISMNSAVNAECTNLQPGQVLNLRKRSRIMNFD